MTHQWVHWIPINVIAILRNLAVFIQNNIKRNARESKQFLTQFLVWMFHKVMMNRCPALVVVAFNNLSGTVQRVATNGYELSVRRWRRRRQPLQIIQGIRTIGTASRPEIWRGEGGRICEINNGMQWTSIWTPNVPMTVWRPWVMSWVLVTFAVSRQIRGRRGKSIIILVLCRLGRVSLMDCLHRHDCRGFWRKMEGERARSKNDYVWNVY